MLLQARLDVVRLKKKKKMLHKLDFFLMHIIKSFFCIFFMSFSALMIYPVGEIMLCILTVCTKGVEQCRKEKGAANCSLWSISASLWLHEMHRTLIQVML